MSCLSTTLLIFITHFTFKFYKRRIQVIALIDCDRSKSSVTFLRNLMQRNLLGKLRNLLYHVQSDVTFNKCEENIVIAIVQLQKGYK
jgi:hypothetical protein